MQIVIVLLFVCFPFQPHNLVGMVVNVGPVWLLDLTPVVVVIALAAAGQIVSVLRL